MKIDKTTNWVSLPFRSLKADCFFALSCIFILSSVNPVGAQTLLGFAGGIMSDGGIEISWSIGELVVSTASDGKNSATQGFHQPFLNETEDTTLHESNHTVNVITANNDGINDNFLIENAEKQPNNRLVIFNRWREIVYQTEGYQNDWKGTAQNGQLLPQAAYYYTYYPDKKSKQPQRGIIHVLRE